MTTTRPEAFRQTVVVAVSLAVLAGCGAEPGPLGAGSEGPMMQERATQAVTLQPTSSFIDLRLRTGQGAAFGGTCGARSEVSSICGNSGNAPDLSFRWTAPVSGNFTFTTHGSTYDTVLQLSQWGTGVALGCSDNADDTAQSSVSLYVPQGRQLRITVDGAGGNGCGDFQLNITSTQANCGTEYCDASPGACHAPFGTCVAGACHHEQLVAGSACEDGDTCTQGDTCNSLGTCFSGPNTCGCWDGRPKCNGRCCDELEYCTGLSCRFNYCGMEGSESAICLQ